MTTADFVALPLAGAVVVALSERIGTPVQLTLRVAGAEHTLAFLDPLAFEARWLLDVPIGAAAARQHDPWLAEVCGAFHENPAAHWCFALFGGQRDIRFRIVARSYHWS